MAQQRRSIAEALRADLAAEGVFRVLVHADQVVVEPAERTKCSGLVMVYDSKTESWCYVS